MNCINCGLEFEGRKDAKFCSPKCRKEAFQKRSVGTDNATFSEPAGTDNFEFYTITKARQPLDDAPKEADAKSKPRRAKYWYEVPIAAIPIIKSGWPDMPDYMNGRQYFLWWKNEFKLQDDKDKPGLGFPVLNNPFPKRERLEYIKAGEGSRRWGT